MLVELTLRHVNTRCDFCVTSHRLLIVNLTPQIVKHCNVVHGFIIDASNRSRVITLMIVIVDHGLRLSNIQFESETFENIV